MTIFFIDERIDEHTIYAITESLEGQFKNGILHGEGKMTYADGKITTGRWSNNIFDG